MSERTVVKLFKPDDIIQAILHQTLRSQGIKACGQFSYTVRGDASRMVRVEVTFNEGDVIKNNE